MTMMPTIALATITLVMTIRITTIRAMIMEIMTTPVTITSQSPQRGRAGRTPTEAGDPAPGDRRRTGYVRRLVDELPLSAPWSSA